MPSAGTDIGVDASGPCGVNLSHNAFVRNMTGVTLSYRAVGSVYRNAFTGNDVGLTSSNTNDGTSFMKAEKNVALFNRDGFYITGTGDQLGGNTAKWNSGWGIYAPNSVDLGGNKASANGSNPQCVGVICSQIR